MWFRREKEALRQDDFGEDHDGYHHALRRPTLPRLFCRPPLSSTPRSLRHSTRAFRPQTRSTSSRAPRLDPELINQVAAAAKAAGAQVEILDPVTDTGSETAAASLNIVVNGQPLQQGLQASFVYEDGVWKLSKTTACQIVGVAGLTSPACAA